MKYVVKMETFDRTTRGYESECEAYTKIFDDEAAAIAYANTLEFSWSHWTCSERKKYFEEINVFTSEVDEDGELVGEDDSIWKVSNENGIEEDYAFYKKEYMEDYEKEKDPDAKARILMNELQMTEKAAYEFIDGDPDYIPEE